MLAKRLIHFCRKGIGFIEEYDKDPFETFMLYSYCGDCKPFRYPCVRKSYEIKSSVLVLLKEEKIRKTKKDL